MISYCGNIIFLSGWTITSCSKKQHSSQFTCRRCTIFIIFRDGWSITLAKVPHIALINIIWGLITPLTCHLLNWVVHWVLDVWTQTSYPTWYGLLSPPGEDNLLSTLFMCCSYWYMPLAGALDGVSSHCNSIWSPGSSITFWLQFSWQCSDIVAQCHYPLGPRHIDITFVGSICLQKQENLGYKKLEHYLSVS